MKIRISFALHMTRLEAFKAFLGHFSVADLPITFSDDNVPVFSRMNPPLSEGLIRKFVLFGDESDELTEYVPCCRIPDTGDIHAVVYWRGRLLEYDYVLHTYNKNGVPVAVKIIAGIRSDGANVKRSVAIIDEDWIIHIVAGEQVHSEPIYNPLKSQAMSMELLASGEIIFSLQD